MFWAERTAQKEQYSSESTIATQHCRPAWSPSCFTISLLDRKIITEGGSIWVSHTKHVNGPRAHHSVALKLGLLHALTLLGLLVMFLIKRVEWRGRGMGRRSVPCQAYTTLKHREQQKARKELLVQRKLVEQWRLYKLIVICPMCGSIWEAWAWDFLLYWYLFTFFLVSQ